MADNTSDAQLDFLLQVLQATADSNGDQQVVYPLLAANIDKINQTLAEKLRDWATRKLAEAKPDEAKLLAAGILFLSYLIQQFPLGDQASNIEIAITGYEVALTVFTREAFPIDWASTQTNIGNAYYHRIKGEKAQNIEEAIACWQQALTVFTFEAFPEYWARTQTNLGNAYRDRIKGEKAQKIEEAIACYQQALRVLTFEAFPDEWAKTQYNLGIAYAHRIKGDKAEKIEDAIPCFQQALRVLTFEAFPYEWALTKTNLGGAYYHRIKGEKAQKIEQAIPCFQQALRVLTFEAFPDEWAMTQNNLGLAYGERIKGEKAQNIEVAIACYQEALRVLTFEAFPDEWASTKYNLGIAYYDRIKGEKAQKIEVAIACYQEALRVLTFRHLQKLTSNPRNAWVKTEFMEMYFEAFPYEWARTKYNLGIAYYDRIKGEKAQKIEEAIACFQKALIVYTFEAFPIEWARTQTNLGIAYDERIKGDKGQKIEEAIACFQEALIVTTFEAFPIEWATTQNNLGNAYGDRIKGQKAENIEEAIACYQQALRVRTFEAFPIDWAMTQNNLGLAYNNRIIGQKAQNIEEAIACYQQALRVRTFEAFPIDWAMTQNNLGLAYNNRIIGQKAQNIEEAIACFQQALRVRTFEAFPIDWTMTQNNLGLAYNNRIKGEKAQNSEEAIACYQQALRVRTFEAFPIEWAMTQHNLGFAYNNRIKGEKAQNSEEAIACYQQALRVRTFEAFPIEWAMTQNNLGAAYGDRIKGEKAENIEQAIACLQQALRVYTFEAFPIEWANKQNNLGAAYYHRIKGEKAQNIEQAIACLQQALRVRTFEAFPIEWASTQNNLGAAYGDRIKGEKAQNIEEAIACYQQALRVYTFEAFPIDWATTQTNLGIAYGDRKKGEKAQNIKQAIACYQQALRVSTFEAFPQDYLDTNNNLGFAYRDAQNFREAYKAFDAAIKTVEFLRDEISSGSGVEEYKTKLAEKNHRSYQGMVLTCLDLTNITEAIDYVERSKTGNLVEEILSRDLKTIFPADVVTQLEQYRDEIAIGQYKIQHGKAENIKVLAQRLQELRQQRNDLQDQHLRIGSSFNFEEFQNKLDDHTAIIEFYITGDKLLSFIFTSETQQPIVWQSEPQDLDKLVKWINGYLRAYNNHKTWLSNRKYPKESPWQCHLNTRLHLLAKIIHIDEVIQQIPPECDRLILIPHLYLHLLPLHALPINSQQGEGKSEIMMDRFPAGVSYAPSCQLLQLTQTRKRPDFIQLFAVQNPTADLVYTNIGVEVIKGYFNPPPDTEVLVENAATKAAIDSKPLNTYHCVHFSCHGYFNLNQPQKSALILADSHFSPAPAKLNPEQHLPLDDGEVIDLDKCLTLDAVFALKLEKCRLVTLSACETGLVKLNNVSDEYIGLPSGFIVAGSPAVVSSLWKVNELSTALLMIKFYENLRNQMSLAVALNKAQFWLRDVTKEELQQWASHLPLSRNHRGQLGDWFYKLGSMEKPFQEPYHWAAFCAIGKWS
ncbi:MULTISPECIES: CHAT domain-containing tetratricopeptide repeat protein [unclassified Moorena]|uniref:CHAT domain-containing protein n=1 Tax=unclassified Moorena TaxID=2683338 RepID=UPI00140180B2|nr:MULTISPECIES: CHAT domain-containing tetratricopeptide repeat protein [unclassified Moorena]NEO14418.1 CHAT domain-containing protein [Moorena sp. SIO3E8]NEQ00829.1 CHAT domain-containing protein [Moorena sp. SIO3F7]